MTTGPPPSDARRERLILWSVSFALIAVGVPVSLMVVFPDARSVDYDPGPLSNLKKLVVAIYNYAEAHDLQLPPAVVTDKAGRPLCSWRVPLLPYLHEQRLFKEFHLDEPWDSEHNKTLIAKMPAAYRSPYSDDPGRARIGFTFYQVKPESDTESDTYRGDRLCGKKLNCHKS